MYPGALVHIKQTERARVAAALTLGLSSIRPTGGKQSGCGASDSQLHTRRVRLLLPGLTQHGYPCCGPASSPQTFRGGAAGPALDTLGDGVGCDGLRWAPALPLLPICADIDFLV